jgi:hypothetical protein
LNAIPVLSEYRDHPDDFYLLRVGYGGTMGMLANIDQEGFLAPAFHAFPDMLKPDGITGDNGPSFFGHAFDTATYVVKHPEFGWVAFGGNVRVDGETVSFTPLDSARTRIYLASAGLWLTLDAGQFEKIEVNEKTGAIRMGFAPATQFTKQARLRVEQPAKLSGVRQFHSKEELKIEREAYVVPLSSGPTWIELTGK